MSDQNLNAGRNEPSEKQGLDVKTSETSGYTVGVPDGVPQGAKSDPGGTGGVAQGIINPGNRDALSGDEAGTGGINEGVSGGSATSEQARGNPAGIATGGGATGANSSGGSSSGAVGGSTTSGGDVPIRGTTDTEG